MTVEGGTDKGRFPKGYGDAGPARRQGHLEKARVVLKFLSGARKAVSMYPPHHEMCRKALDEFHRVLRDFLQETGEYSLRIIEDEFFFQEKLLAGESILYYPLLEELKEKDIGGVTFHPAVDKEGLERFLLLLNRGAEDLREAGGIRSLLEKEGIAGITLDEPGAWEEKRAEELFHPTAREEYMGAVEVMRELADQVIRDRKLKVGKANRVVGIMLSRLGENRSAVLGLATLKSYDEYTFYHSVNVLILSLALASMLPLDRSALMVLGTGALLHDLGKITIPQHILTKPGPLTGKEWEIMRSHPVRGADILLAQPGVNPLSVTVAFEHHVRYDLSGYPGLKHKKRQGLFARIVQIADVYDAMTTSRPYQRARSPFQALRILAMDRGTAFDPLLVRIFIDMMGFYPVGTLVRLHTGELAMVHDQNPGEPLYPKVKIIADEDGNEVEPRVVDLLSRRESLGEGRSPVLEVINPYEAGMDVFEYL